MAGEDVLLINECDSIFGKEVMLSVTVILVKVV